MQNGIDDAHAICFRLTPTYSGIRMCVDWRIDDELHDGDQEGDVDNPDSYDDADWPAEQVVFSFSFLSFSFVSSVFPTIRCLLLQLLFFPPGVPGQSSIASC